jgi:hypothetical protein
MRESVDVGNSKVDVGALEVTIKAVGGTGAVDTSADNRFHSCIN